MTRFHRRSGNIEIMDDLLCSGEVVYQTLRELDTINQLLGGNHVTLSGLKKVLAGKSFTQALTIVDWGCGSGDMLKRVAEWGRSNKIPMQLTGIDANPNIVAYALGNCKDYSEISVETENVFSDSFRRRNFDVVIATLFTHHFTDDELIDLLRFGRSQAKVGIVINDIHRHWLAYYSIRLLTRIFSRSAMVKFDAPLSVMRAFRRSEWLDLINAAGIRDFSLKWRWAFRWQVIVGPDRQV